MLLFCLISPLFNTVFAQVSSEFTEAEARRIEVDADYLRKQCLPLMASRRASIPEGSPIKPLFTALFSDEYCICTLQNYRRNMPVKAFREKDEPELVAFTKRSAATCALNLLHESMGEVCPPMMAGIAKQSIKRVPQEFVPGACSCFETILGGISTDDLEQMLARIESDMEQMKISPKTRLDDEPSSMVGRMQSCLVKSGFLPPLRK